MTYDLSPSLSFTSPHGRLQLLHQENASEQSGTTAPMRYVNSYSSRAIALSQQKAMPWLRLREHTFTALLLLSRWAIAPAPNQNQESEAELTGTIARMCFLHRAIAPSEAIRENRSPAL